MCRRVYCILFALVLLLYICPLNVESGTRVYENENAIIYQLPPRRSTPEACESAAELVLRELAQKGLMDCVGEIGPHVVTKLGGFFLTFIGSAQVVGIPTRVEVEVLAGEQTANSIPASQDFLPLVAIQGGDCFNTGVFLSLEEAEGLFQWEAVERARLITHAELDSLLEGNMIGLDRPFLVVPKSPFSLVKEGKYRIVANAWCDGEGESSKTIKIVKSPEFAEDFSRDLSAWYVAGVARIDPWSGHPGPSLEPRGSDAYNACVLSRNSFDLKPGFALQVDAYTTKRAMFSEFWMGVTSLDRIMLLTGYTGLLAGFWYGSGHDPVHLMFQGQDIGTLPNELISSWQTYEIRITRDRYVQYYVNGKLQLTSPQRLYDKDVRILLGGRAYGAATRFDNVVVIQ